MPELTITDHQMPNPDHTHSPDQPDRPVRPWWFSPLKPLLLALLRFYKMAISPGLPPACRYHPSCSEYAYEAIEKYGIIKGGWLASWRLLRCNPFSKGGWDPVK